MVPNDINIRLAVAADCDAILAMLTKLAGETGDGDRFRCRIEDIRDHGFGRHSLFRCLIASRQDSNLGLALFFPMFSTTRAIRSPAPRPSGSRSRSGIRSVGS